MMTVIRNAVGIVRRNWKAYVTINLLYYGLVVVAMLFVVSHPEIQKELLKAVRQAFGGKGPLAAVGGVYKGGHVAAAIVLTFIVNLVLGSVFSITVPSMIVPFSGFLMGIFRAIMWGLLLCPAEPSLRGGMIPHSLTLLLEGQAYIVALLAAYTSGNAFLRPRSVGGKLMPTATWKA